jgi:hypothetical protein
MPIPLDPPIIVPGVTQTYDIWFFRDFHAAGLTPTSGTLVFTRVPMSSTTGAVHEPGAQTISVPFWDAVNQIPEAAAAMNQVLAALPLIQAHFTNP